jgi:hypothetical protein
MILKDGVVYLDLVNDRLLQQLEGKHVFRLSSQKNDRSYMDGCIKIIHVSSIGEILYEDNDRFLPKRRICFLASKWNDGKWGVVTPAKNGRAFFENICTIIDPLSQKKAVLLVEKIFTSLEEDCHLSEKTPFASLREYCIKGKKENLLIEIDALERLVGSFSVTILSKKSTGDFKETLDSKL